MSRIGRYCRLFFRDPIRREKMLQTYIHHRNLYSKGNGEFGFLWELVKPQNMMITWLFLRDLWPATPLWVILAGFPLFVAMKLTFKWSVGWFWDRYNVFDLEQNWANQRNPLAKEINDKLLGQEAIQWESQR